MKKRLIPAALLSAVLLLFCACAVIQIPLGPATTKTSATEAQMQAPPSASMTAEETESLMPSGTGEAGMPAPGEDGTDEESCAFITAISSRPDGRADITFDYVDWLTGDEARETYLEDYPGATEEEMEDAGLLEIGYIRNVNPRLRTYPTDADTEYFLPDPEDIVMNVPVTYDAFLDTMVPAVEEDSYLTFVKVRIEGGVIASMEWLYTP